MEKVSCYIRKVSDFRTVTDTLIPDFAHHFRAYNLELVIWNLLSDCLFQIAYFRACNMELVILLCALWSSFGEITSEFYQLGE